MNDMEQLVKYLKQGDFDTASRMARFDLDMPGIEAIKKYQKTKDDWVLINYLIGYDYPESLAKGIVRAYNTVECTRCCESFSPQDITLDEDKVVCDSCYQIMTKG